MTPPTQCDYVQGFCVWYWYGILLFGLGNRAAWSVGWCSAQRIRNPMIAGGNHTLIHMTPPYRDQFFQNSLLNSTRWAMSSTQPQVMKQSATLNTGKRMNSTSIMSTT